MSTNAAHCSNSDKTTDEKLLSSKLKVLQSYRLPNVLVMLNTLQSPCCANCYDLNYIASTKLKTLSGACKDVLSAIKRHASSPTASLLLVTYRVWAGGQLARPNFCAPRQTCLLSLADSALILEF